MRIDNEPTVVCVCVCVCVCVVVYVHVLCVVYMRVCVCVSRVHICDVITRVWLLERNGMIQQELTPTTPRHPTASSCTRIMYQLVLERISTRQPQAQRRERQEQKEFTRLPSLKTGRRKEEEVGKAFRPCTAVPRTSSDTNSTRIDNEAACLARRLDGGKLAATKGSPGAAQCNPRDVRTEVAAGGCFRATVGGLKSSRNEYALPSKQGRQARRTRSVDRLRKVSSFEHMASYSVPLCCTNFVLRTPPVIRSKLYRPGSHRTHGLCLLCLPGSKTYNTSIIALITVHSCIFLSHTGLERRRSRCNYHPEQLVRPQVKRVEKESVVQCLCCS